jgi:hypothetical protein
MLKLREWSELYFLFLFLFFNVFAYAGEEPLGNTSVFYFQTDERYVYRTELLQLALSYTEAKNPPITLVANPNIPTARAVDLMERDSIRGIVSFATSVEREKKLRAIKIPIMAGILGMRVFLIHKDLQLEFSEITTYSQLKNYVAGFGEHWGDLAILKENGLNVMPVAKYQSLFNMLNAKRFDFFPRGVNEILAEYKKQIEALPNLKIEEDIAIYYPYPVYFFVNKKDDDFAKRIQYGLEQAQQDGRFKALFMSHHQDLMTRLNFGQRKVFNVENNTLPSRAEIINKSWWLKDK